MSKRIAGFIATSASLILLWLGLAALLHVLFRLDSADGSLLFAEGIATLTAIAMWYAKSDRWNWDGSAGKWLGIFVVSLPISVLFVEIDCGGTLHFADGVLTCAHYGGGISIAFTIGSLATTAVALPSALRAWLLGKLEPHTEAVRSSPAEPAGDPSERSPRCP